MAELTKAVLGRFSGKLGDTVFRQRNGKNFVGTRPRRYAPPGDQASVNRRARFAISAKLAQAMYTIPELLSFWEPLTPAGLTTYNYMIQKNILVINPTSVSDLTTITPERSFPIVCNNASQSGNAIAIELAAIGAASGIDVAKVPNAKLACVLSLTGPANETFQEFEFVSGTSETRPLTPDDSITFNFPLSGQDVASMESYTDRKILLALLTLDGSGNAVGYSGTVVSPVTPSP